MKLTVYKKIPSASFVFRDRTRLLRVFLLAALTENHITIFIHGNSDVVQVYNSSHTPHRFICMVRHHTAILAIVFVAEYPGFLLNSLNRPIRFAKS